MITITPEDAHSKINAKILAVLIAYDPLFYIQWPGIFVKSVPPADKFWCRVSHQTVNSEQNAIALNCGAPNKRRYETNGLTFVQFFCPISDRLAYQKGMNLARITRDAFRGAGSHSGDDAVWFYRQRINELPTDQDAIRFNVVTEHQYYEIS